MITTLLAGAVLHSMLVPRPELANGQDSTTVRIDTKPIVSKWEGWGTSLCWMGKMFGGRTDTADLFFTTKSTRVLDGEYPGLGLNIVRYNAGACSWNEFDGRKMVVGKTIQPFRQMEGYWLDPSSTDPKSASWDWSKDEPQRKMMLAAKARGADRIELFSNSPMWWMCKNDNPSGAANALHDNLRDDQFDNFAIYLATVAEQAKRRWGVNFTTVSPFNEPLSGWWDENCKQEGCHFSVAAQTRLLPLLRRELDRRGMKSLPIAASDETYVSHAIDAWRGYPPEVKSIVSQVNVHGYQGEKAPRAELAQLLGSQPRWVSEHGENDASGMALARNLHLDIAGLHPSAWCYWQPLDGGGWGLVDADVPKSKLVRVDPKFFVLAQYSRHIRPGMQLLQTDDTNTVAAFDPKKGRLVLVVLNEKAPRTRTLDLGAFRLGSAAGERWTTEGKGEARYRKSAAPAAVGGKLQLDLPADSVTTVQFSRVQVAPR